MKEKYVNIGKNLKIKEFEKFNAPTGWYRIDILKKLMTYLWRNDFNEK